MSATQSALTLAEAHRMVRESMRDKSYQLYPLGQEAAAYLRIKRKRLTDESYRTYESCLDKLARHFTDLDLEDFEPPIGTQRIEEFLDVHWGDSAPATYNRALAILRGFFKYHAVRGRLHGSPMLAIEPARRVQPHREIFSGDDRRGIIASQDSLRDRIALRLLFDYGLRKGALRRVQYRHFDHVRKRLTIFTKGSKVRELPIPDAAFWDDLGRLLIDMGAEGSHYLMAKWSGASEGWGRAPVPSEPMGGHGLHSWWYRCLNRAGVTAVGEEAGERMHKARHTAGQRVLDHTGNLKATQMFLGHEHISTTGDIYTSWTLDQQEATLASVLAAEPEEES